MQVTTIEVEVPKAVLKYEDHTPKTQYVQQVDISDIYDFIKPMSEYIAHLMIKS